MNSYYLNNIMLIIAATGYACSGKSTFCEILKGMLLNKKISEYAFAEKIKKIASIAFEEPIDNYNSQIKKLESPVNCDVTRRMIMCKIADVFREFNPHIFEPDFKKFDCDILIISDLRFMREYELIKNSGHKYLIVKIIDKKLGKIAHNSEKDIEIIPENYLFDNTDKTNYDLIKKFTEDLIKKEI
jgi:hypothetical protein